MSLSHLLALDVAVGVVVVLEPDALVLVLADMVALEDECKRRNPTVWLGCSESNLELINPVLRSKMQVS